MAALELSLKGGHTLQNHLIFFNSIALFNMASFSSRVMVCGIGNSYLRRMSGEVNRRASRSDAPFSLFPFYLFFMVSGKGKIAHFT
jgi:hypothetical protein